MNKRILFLLFGIIFSYLFSFEIIIQEMINKCEFQVVARRMRVTEIRERLFRPNIGEEAKKLYQRWKKEGKNFPGGYLDTVEGLEQVMQECGLELKGLTFFSAFKIWEEAIYMWYAEREVAVPHVYEMDLDRVEKVLQQALKIEGMMLDYATLQDRLTGNSTIPGIVKFWRANIMKNGMGDVYLVGRTSIFKEARSFLNLARNEIEAFEEITCVYDILSAIEDFYIATTLVLRGIDEIGTDRYKIICIKIRLELEKALQLFRQLNLKEYMSTIEEMLYALDHVEISVNSERDEDSFEDLIERAKTLIEQGVILEKNEKVEKAKECYKKALHLIGIKLYGRGTPEKLTADNVCVVWAVKKYFEHDISLTSAETLVAIGRSDKDITVNRLVKKFGISIKGIQLRLRKLKEQIGIGDLLELWYFWQFLLREEELEEGLLVEQFSEKWIEDFEYD